MSPSLAVRPLKIFAAVVGTGLFLLLFSSTRIGEIVFIGFTLACVLATVGLQIRTKGKGLLPFESHFDPAQSLNYHAAQATWRKATWLTPLGIAFCAAMPAVSLLNPESSIALSLSTSLVWMFLVTLFGFRFFVHSAILLGFAKHEIKESDTPFDELDGWVLSYMDAHPGCEDAQTTMMIEFSLTPHQNTLQPLVNIHTKEGIIRLPPLTGLHAQDLLYWVGTKGDILRLAPYSTLRVYPVNLNDITAHAHLEKRAAHAELREKVEALIAQHPMPHRLL